MIPLNKLRIDNACLGKKMLLVDVRPYYQYDNGVKGNDVQGYKYSAALPALNLEKIDVKIEGKQLMELPADGSFVKIEFTGLEIGLYERDKRLNLTAKATGIAPANRKTNQ